MTDFMKYFFDTFICSDDWTQVNISSDIHRPFESIGITNDDATYSAIVVLNDLSHDEITIKAGESISLNVEVYRLWYKTATAGQTPIIRVVAD